MSIVKLKKISVIVAAAMLAVTLQFMMHLIPTSAETITYTYDANGRLIKADYGDGTSITYTYDAAGNITGESVAFSTEPQYTLKVTKAGTGSGTVSPSTGSLGWNGSIWAAQYPANTSVTLTAGATQGSAFFGWSGEGCSGTGTCTVTMTRAMNVTATFALNVTSDFTATPISGSAPLLVSFTDTTTPAPVSWQWNFGDSSTSTLQNPLHNYKSVGSYTVSLTANGPSGSTMTKNGYINVAACGNQSVKIGETNTYFSSIQGGYGELQSGQHLQMQALDFTESLNLQNSTVVTLKGGYGCDYSANLNYTTIHGSVTIRGGTVTVERITIAP